MFFQFQILVYSLIFWGVMEMFSQDAMGDANFFSSIWFALLIFVILGVYFYQVATRVSRRTSMAPMPLVFVASSIGMLYFVQSQKQANLLIVLAAIAYYFIHLALYRLRSCHTDKTAFGIIAAGNFATIFLFYVTAYGIYLNFNIPLWILMISMMGATTLVSFQYFWLIDENKRNVLNFSLVLGFVIAEIVWVLNFWPFGYLTTGVINLIFYYVFWDLVQCHFVGSLSKKRVVTNVIVFGLLVALVLSSTRWLPIV